MLKLLQSKVITKYLLYIAAVILLCSCFPSTQYNVAQSQVRPEFTGEVLVFNKTVPQNIKFTVMGDFVSQSEWYGGADATASSAVTEAAAKGANGILIEAQGHRVTAFSYASPYTEGKLLWIENYDEARRSQSEK